MANIGINGVKYFKDVAKKFDDDEVKQCGLTGSEIDGNFYFLRRNDIKSGSFDEETGIITLERVDCDRESIVIEGIANYIEGKVSEKEPHTFEGTYYNPTEEILYVYFDNVLATAVTQFRIDSIVNVGEGMFGDGSVDYPVRVSPMYKTGYFAPVERLYDMTAGEVRPVGITAGYRCLTKEEHSDSGLLYDREALDYVIDKLNSPEYNPNGWRVPTIDDWNDMLNASEDCEHRNHHTAGDGPKGAEAGFNLKHPEYWGNEDDNVTGNGFNVVPTKFDPDEEKLNAYFWTATDSPIGGDTIGKRFEERKGTVCSVNLNNHHDFASIRLVNDNNHGRITDSEEILGKVYDTRIFSGETVNGVAYLQRWTTVNLGYEAEQGHVTEPSVKFEDSSSIRYYVNEWDGYSWRKTELKENYTVVINDYSGFSYYEWTVVKNEETNELELKSREEILRGHLSDDFSGLTDNIEQVLTNLNNAKEEIHEEIEQAKSDLNERITEEVATLNETIQEKDTEHAALVTSETVRATDRETELDNKIDSEVARATAEEENIKQQISELESDVNTAISGLTDEIVSTNDKVDELSGTCNTLNDKIDDAISQASGDATSVLSKVIALP